VVGRDICAVLMAEHVVGEYVSVVAGRCVGYIGVCRTMALKARVSWSLRVELDCRLTK
jgi:hypothetical protein